MTKKFKDLITSVDVLNTLHGGVSEAVLSFREQEDGRELRVRVPGIRRETLQVEIINNELSVYYLIPIESQGETVHMPQIVHNQTIPYYIDVDGIKAKYADNELVVNLPYNERSNGKNRRIKIEE